MHLHHGGLYPSTGSLDNLFPHLTASCQESGSSSIVTNVTDPVAKQRETVNEAQSLDPPQLSSSLF